jgi:4-hydroxybutyrate CoA-transferase
MDIKVGVKYCGGCNPNYDRKKIVNTVETQLGIKAVLYNEEEIPDIALVVCGCSAECLKADKFVSKYRTMLINSPEQIEEVIECIRSIKQQSSCPDQIQL